MRHLWRLYESPIDLLIAASSRRVDFFFCIVCTKTVIFIRGLTRFIYRIERLRSINDDGNFMRCSLNYANARIHVTLDIDIDGRGRWELFTPRRCSRETGDSRSQREATLMSTSLPATLVNHKNDMTRLDPQLLSYRSILFFWFARATVRKTWRPYTPLI